MTSMPRTAPTPIPVRPSALQSRVASPNVAAPILSIVIVNYRQWRNTARLVRQLLKSPALRSGDAEIVVVDNHSPYDSVRMKLRRAPGVSLRCLRQNRGFARGANEGCRLGRGRWFLLLNPDVTAPAGSVERAMERIERIGTEEPRAGIVGLQLRDSDGNRQGSVGIDPTFLGTLVGLLRPRSTRKCSQRIMRRCAKVPWVTGCGLLLRRECFLAVRGFDPDYFLYSEDADLCRRARAAGWTVWHEPNVQLVHHCPLHGRKVPSRTRLLTRHALLTFARKHWPAWQVLFFASLIWVEALLRGPRRFRPLRRMAADFLLGKVRRAYRRVWHAAQWRGKSVEGIRVESSKASRRGNRERRPLPR